MFLFLLFTVGIISLSLLLLPRRFRHCTYGFIQLSTDPQTTKADEKLI